MLRKKELIEKLPISLDEKSRERFDVAFRSIGYLDQYCRYHYEMFKTELADYHSCINGENLKYDDQYYRIAFEANAYAFFRALHSLIESVPYLLNILLNIKPDIEDRSLKWETIKKYPDQEYKLLIEELRASKSYVELEHLVNISKHRRVPRIDCGKLQKEPRFWDSDLDEEFRFYEIETLMEELYNELYPKLLEIISFITGKV